MCGKHQWQDKMNNRVFIILYRNAIIVRAVIFVIRMIILITSAAVKIHKTMKKSIENEGITATATLTENRQMEHWKTEKLIEIYLDGVRGAIPFAYGQIDILLRVISFFKTDVTSFLDLGCGDGILGRTIFSRWSHAKGIFVDYSESMIKAAKTKNRQYQDQSTFAVLDFGNANWLTSIADKIPVDTVISGFSIHHQSDNNKKRIYKEIFDKILKPGGVFLNLEQVKSPTQEIETIFNDFFMDSMRNFQQENNSNISIDAIEKSFYDDKKVNVLSPVDEQCKWLKKQVLHKWTVISKHLKWLFLAELNQNEKTTRQIIKRHAQKTSVPFFSTDYTEGRQSVCKSCFTRGKRIGL
jgi:ubiquinone/menaquinone biosynthesis C-methylase UbiE